MRACLVNRLETYRQQYSLYIMLSMAYQAELKDTVQVTTHAAHLHYFSLASCLHKDVGTPAT